MKRLTLIDTTATALVSSAMGPMRRLTTVTLMLVLAVATAYAHNESVKLTFSGVSDTSPDNLQQPDTSNDGDNFAGDGTLGKFNVRLVRAISNTAGSSSTCTGADHLFLTELAGGGRVSLPRWQPAERQSDAGGRLHQSHDRSGSLHIDLPSHWWNGPFQARIRSANDDGEGKRRAIRCPRQPCRF
jgi:hypothetical protein